MSNVEILNIPVTGYVEESVVRKLFHPGDAGQKAFEKAFRGCTMMVADNGKVFMPVSDLQDHLTYRRQTD
ncbi:hypothetical protein ST201phi2-1p176 [Pseudomonas phage 201phi2-1]|uniref:Uncharacterized protein n=1 Tax=Pseudomonas phage 201phi2-1 TaxID=198110 RepID=B3FJ39_BP201|nr:hypothetical protein ST201phi2-1p176 [Pseudomonas phage 201phi2-1]ABY63006.1 hypothetical protein 201phi2-1p176 [Pseudomonas phage 201phi2-1]